MRVLHKQAVALLAAVGIGAGVGLWNPGSGADEELIFISVGQGDCTAIKEGASAVLIDVGPKDEFTDAGERYVVPALRRYGVQAVSLIVLTHPDLDHTGGLSALHSHFPDAKVAISDQFRSYKKLQDQLRSANIPSESVTWLPHESSFDFGNAQLRVFAPPWREGRNDNEGSLLMLVQQGAGRAVVTGDADQGAEKMALQDGNWKADVMHCGHHGSRTATGDEWLKAVAPRIAVISCGRNNRYGHPHAAVLRKLEAARVPVLRTDEQGDIVMTPGSNGYDVRGK
ncbi:MAG: MBL fold metallo-hydrolase [Armatimonadetes bacterium]|nr:MBL fold metallo-hydrolase [Armatimonadota bacterium]